MDLETWKTLANVILASGIGLSALGTFGAYYFSNRLDQRRESIEADRRVNEETGRNSLNDQIGRLVAGNEDLKLRLMPFEALARSRYPGVDNQVALEKLQGDIAGLKSQAVELEKKVRAANPVRQPIRSASATVELLVRSDDKANVNYADSGGMFALARGDQPLLTTLGYQSSARQTGSGQVAWRGVWEMDAADKAVGKPVFSLRDANYAQIVFAQLPDGSEILSGSVRLTINSAVQLDFPVPKQVSQKQNILIREVGRVLDQLNVAEKP